MGFRFYRRVKILPGLNLNFSGSGLSLSTGVRGAHVTFGPKGTTTSVGIPGTGLSYRQRVRTGKPSVDSRQFTRRAICSTGDPANNALALKVFREGDQTVSMKAEELRRLMADSRFKIMDPNTDRRLSQRQIEARIRDAELDEKVEHAKAALKHEEELYQQVVDFWKPLPEIASSEDWNNATESKPFEPNFSPPDEPDWTSCQAQMLKELTEKHSNAGWRKFLPALVARAAARKEFPVAWPEREASVEADY